MKPKDALNSKTALFMDLKNRNYWVGPKIVSAVQVIQIFLIIPAFECKIKYRHLPFIRSFFEDFGNSDTPFFGKFHRNTSGLWSYCILLTAKPIHYIQFKIRPCINGRPRIHTEW